MITITVALFGDYWLNPQEVEDKIRSVPVETPVHLDFQAEGVSVTASGIQQKILDICAETGRSRDSIKIINNPNIYENLEFENIGATRAATRNQPFRSHFLSGDLIRSYWRDPVATKADARLFGLFIGRRTVARDSIMRQCSTRPDRFLLSRMIDPLGLPSHDLAELPAWSANSGELQQWRQTSVIESLDGKSITDQYTRFVPKPVTNSSILEFYDRFHIEVVAETYTRGDTFFPTEKTARPISVEKPILVYGPKNFLARLRDLYGYQTYGDHWDESYDQLEGPERWRAMWRSMQDITVDHRMMEIARHNREILRKMKDWEI